jgi:hypothetical protein
MTDEMFAALAEHEGLFERVKARKYQPYPGLAVLQLMLSAVREVRPNYRTNLGCSSCVRSLVLETAGLYYTEKAERQAKETPVDTPEPTEPSKTSKPRRKPAKSKAIAE